MSVKSLEFSAAYDYDKDINTWAFYSSFVASANYAISFGHIY